MHYQLSAADGALDRLVDSADPMADVHAALQTDLSRLAAGYDSAELLHSAHALAPRLGCGRMGECSTVCSSAEFHQLIRP